jgi:diguanylate cyclase (GGDEF)-like protein
VKNIFSIFSKGTAIQAEEPIGVHALQTTLRAASRFRSPAIGALLILAILLGKAVVCEHAPTRAVFFDAMLMVPVSMLAYHEGLVTGLVGGIVAIAVDIVIGAKVSGTLIPAFIANNALRGGMIAKLFSLEVLAAIVSSLSYRARRQTRSADKQTQEYLGRIAQLRQQNEAIEQDARDKQAVFEKRLLRYSSLVYLLEESVQKIYSNLEIKRLFQSLFRVLEECFGSTCASVYLLEKQNGTYYLASASGADEDSGPAIPMLLRPSDFHIAELERTHQAICWADGSYAARFKELGQDPPAVISGVLMDKGSIAGIVNIHATDREALPDELLMGMVSNIASIALANARLFGEVQWLAERDPLTKLFNRRTFHQRLDQQLTHSAEAGEPCSLLMLDIDHFKSFNDTYGHQAGDAVLEWFAAHCEDCVAEGDTVFRYGGEEFNVLLPGADAEKAAQLANDIRSRVADAAFNYEGIDLRVTLSCGVAVFPENGRDADEMVRKADRALYRAKGAGRNCVAVCETTSGQDGSVVPYTVRVATTAQQP